MLPVLVKAEAVSMDSKCLRDRHPPSDALFPMLLQLGLGLLIPILADTIPEL